MSFNLKIVFLTVILSAKTSVAQEFDIEKFQKLFGKEMTYQIDTNGITCETVHPISISDFEKFQQDVRDSVAIETIFFTLADDNDVMSLLKSNKKIRAHQSNRELNRSMFQLNRDVKNLYTDDNFVIPTLFMRISSAYKPLISSEITFDDRRVYYEMNSTKTFSYLDTSISKTAHPVFHNHWDLSELSRSKHDIPDVLAHVLPVLFKENAPYNLSKNQYYAYLDWKSKKLINELKSRKIAEKVEIVPLFQVDTVAFTITGAELYSHWKIDTCEYFDFVRSVRDSLVRETLYFELVEDEKAIKFVGFSDIYVDEQGLEFVETDPYQRVYNRKLFNLNYSTKIKKRNPEVQAILTKFKLRYSDSLLYCYRTLDLKNSNYTTSPFKMNSYVNLPWLKIDTNNIEILPIKEADSTSLFLNRLTYEQAIAFYNWKYPISKSTGKSNWKHYVFPSKEEFLVMQAQSNISFPDKSFSYTTTTMKYKVLIYN